MPKKPKAAPPTEQELEDALSGLDYVGSQCATWHFWKNATNSFPTDDKTLKDYMHNSLVESSLMFVRKTVEFFEPLPKESNGYPDNIYAYHYQGYSESKWLLSDTDRSELNKRVGHVTVAEVRHGKLDWPLKEWVLLCLGQWIDFFKTMSGIPSKLNPERQRQCLQNADLLSELLDRVQLQRE